MKQPSRPIMPCGLAGPIICSAGGVPYNNEHIEYWKNRALAAEAKLAERTKSAPVKAAAQNTAEGEPMVTLVSAGADTCDVVTKLRDYTLGSSGTLREEAAALIERLRERLKRAYSDYLFQERQTKTANEEAAHWKAAYFDMKDVCQTTIASMDQK
jgi:hypothetical protein